MRIIKIQEVIATIICPIPPKDVLIILVIISQFKLRCSRSTRICLPPLNKTKSCIITPIPLPILVAIAAPSIPISGKGPYPKIKIGSKIILIPLASQRTRIAIAASPAPRKIALIINRSIITILPPSIHCA